jgi:hypothetical protein
MWEIAWTKGDVHGTYTDTPGDYCGILGNCVPSIEPCSMTHNLSIRPAEELRYSIYQPL